MQVHILARLSSSRRKENATSFFFFFGRRKEKKGKKREKERARGKKRGTTLRPLRNALASRDFVAEFVARTKRKM